MINKYECTCSNSGMCVIDPDKQTMMTCGVVGIVDLQNARIVNGVVECVSCKCKIYEQGI